MSTYKEFSVEEMAFHKRIQALKNKILGVPNLLCILEFSEESLKDSNQTQCKEPVCLQCVVQLS